MEILTHMIGGFSDISNIQCILMICFGTLLGIIIGALPGLTATTGVSIFLPMTFFMEPIPGIAFLLGIYCGGMYGGSITAILINTPGTPSGAATVLDGHPLAKQGQALKALQMALYASTIAGLISCIILIVVSPQLAKVALSFGPSEYFALGLFGLTVVCSLSSGNMIKGLVSACLGLTLSFVGLDPVNGGIRLTFGTVILQNGFTLIPTLIGLFAMSEILMQSENIFHRIVEEKMSVHGEKLSWAELRRSLPTIVRSSFIGSFIGAVPATGGSVAAFLSYSEAKRWAKNPDDYGKGEINGVAAAEAGNNGVTGATLIPLLTLCIPGDSVTAVLLGALMVQGLTPGPMLFQTEARTIYGIYAGLIFANIAMFVLGSIGTRFFHRVTDIPKSVLQPIIFGLCCIGTYVSNVRTFELYVMFAVGLLAYLMIKCKFPVAPALLALILGPMIEANLRRGLIAVRGNVYTFVSRPITAAILFVSAASIGFVLYREIKAKITAHTENKSHSCRS
jgi:putative tricarboxylic transport membrane protein